MGTYTGIFMKMTSLSWHHMYIECSQLVQYFAHSFIPRQVLTPLRVTSSRKMNAFSNETCLNVKHQRFIFQHIVQIYLNTYWHTPVRLNERRDCCDRCISAHRSTTFCRSQANFLQVLLRIKLRTKPIFRFFYISKIDRIMPFCNLFIERPSYLTKDL